ncbi:MAG: PD40 domain-containing protein [Bacteroidales bacterium]|nr:PD40 domain-containing protein [Bacteroidales bacterium]
MKSRITHLSGLLLPVVLLFASGLSRSAAAQSLADSLRKAYDFQGAVEWCERMLEVTDSTRIGPIEEQLLLSRNGLNMTRYCSQPEVIAKYRFSREDFFLFYPMENHAWRPVPNQLDSLGGGDWIRAMYVPDGATQIYYSAKDADGIRNLYRTSLKDSVTWEVPELINEEITSSSDEILPFLSRDGQSLYFASKGLYGMGGYDLYVSRWNESTRDWDAPVNLGFPYSSPYDDFLFVHSEDGQYSLFASNRACPQDSVYVYVLAYDSMPVRKSIETVDGLKTLCALQPRDDRSDIGRQTSGGIEEDDNVRRYVAAMDHVRGIRDSISRFNARLDQLRDALRSEEDAARQGALRQEILAGEIALPTHQKQLAAALKELQGIEMDFLANGIVIDPDRLRAEADREVVGASSYVFSKNAMGPVPDLVIEPAQPRFDYSFKILDVGQFAEDNTLPGGLVYQIQLFASSRKATERELKGLSPVFERSGTGGKHVYSAGVFRSYADALSRLNSVKARGFKGAQITAFQDGKLISTAAARKLESQVRILYKVRLSARSGQGLPDGIPDIIHARTDKDIIRVSGGAGTLYEVGPFEEKADAQALVSALQGAGLAEVSLTEVQQ